jgi:hypothetical protein
METMNLRSNQETERAPVHALADACQLLVAVIAHLSGGILSAPSDCSQGD